MIIISTQIKIIIKKQNLQKKNVCMIRCDQTSSNSTQFQIDFFVYQIIHTRISDFIQLYQVKSDPQNSIRFYTIVLNYMISRVVSFDKIGLALIKIL